MTLNRAWLLLAACLMTPITTASANVVTDWDEKAVALIQPRMAPPVAYRAMAILHIAMFDALNSIEPRYRPYYAQFPATQDTSKDAAATAAAGAVLVSLLPEVASDIHAAVQNYLAAMPDSEAKSNGIKVGEAAAAKTLEARASDGSSASDAYRQLAREVALAAGDKSELALEPRPGGLLAGVARWFRSLTGGRAEATRPEPERTLAGVA